ncbi:MAG: segregation/condensation protein A, partial [Coriobacteriia bacterium]|nr:segregation/condensation protein A [Coriobacteriia bacterium]
LVARLLAYKQFKNAAAEINARMEAESRMHPRQAGLEERFLKLMPDFLEDVTLRGLAVICADLMYRREEFFVLQSEHVATVPISLELHAESVARTLAQRGRISFRELVAEDPRPEVVVVTLLAILELYKRAFADIQQDSVFDDIIVTALDQEGGQ